MALRETDTTAAAQATAQRARRSGAPQFSDNPIGAVGLVLSNVAAGMRGQPLPTDTIRQEQLAQQELDLRRLGTTIDAVKHGVEMFSGMDRNDPLTKQAMQRFTEQFETALPGFGDAFKVGLDVADKQGEMALDAVSEHRTTLYALCGNDASCIRKHVTDKDFMQQLNDAADQRRLPAIVAKFDAITQNVDDQTLASLAKGGWTIADLRSLPEGFNFNEDELRTIARNKDIQDALIPSGFKPPEISRKEAETRATESVKAAFREGPEIVQLQKARGQALARGDQEGAKELGDRIEKLSTIVGRTEQDVSANKQDEIRGDLSSVTRARSRLADIRSAIVADRSRAGAAGSISKAIQEGIGIFTDLAALGIDVPDFIKNSLPEIERDLGAGRTDEKIAGYFDPALAQNEVFQNSLAYALARARKGSGRLNKQDFDNAKKDVKLTGLTSSQAVLERLAAIDRELAEAEDDFNARLEGRKGGGNAPRYRIEGGRLMKVE